MADLDHDLLKKTAGLLAEIDRVAAAPTVAERVNRVIESAAPDIRYDTFDSFEAWEEWKVSGYRGPDRHLPDDCGCPRVRAYIHEHDDAEGVVTRPIKSKECEVSLPLRDDPIYWITAPYYRDTGQTHSAQRPCGASGCGCEDLWPPREDIIKAQRGAIRGSEVVMTWLDEARLLAPDEIAAVRENGQRMHDRIQAQFIAMVNSQPPRSLLDITGVD